METLLILMGFLLMILVAGNLLGLRQRRLADYGEDSPPSPHRPLTVLILTAAVGGGHAAAGAAIQEEMEQAGYQGIVVDGIRAMSRKLDRLLIQGYAQPLRHAPWLLRLVFAITSRKPGVLVIRIIVGFVFGPRLGRVIQRQRPDIVISTYPLVNSALGWLRQSGRLSEPAIAVIADYGAHALWVAPGIDLHLVPSRLSAEMVQRADGEAAVAHLPVARRFQAAETRAAARAGLGLPPDAFVVLVIGGAWGIGDVESAVQYAVEAGVWPLVVTGHNQGLRSRLESRFSTEKRIRILGWTTEIPALMRAADCMIQNAGGMTCLEAIEMRLPILLFQPIPGHGTLNASIMARTGAAHWAHSGPELRTLLRSAAHRELALRAGSQESSAPGIVDVLETLPRMRRVPAWRGVRRRPGLGRAFVFALLLWSSTASFETRVEAAFSNFDSRLDGVGSSIGHQIDVQVQRYQATVSRAPALRTYDRTVGTGNFLLGIMLILAATTVYNGAVVLRSAVVRRNAGGRTALGAVSRGLSGPVSIALTGLGWTLEFAALIFIPLTLARVLSVAGLGVLAGLARWTLNEPLGRREVAAMLATAAGIAAVSIASPQAGTGQPAGQQWLLLLLILGPGVLLLYAIRTLRHPLKIAFGSAAAGLAYAMSGIFTKGAADALTSGMVIPLALLAAAVVIAGLVGFLIELAALRDGAVSVVAPIVLAIHTLVPIVVAPIFFHEVWPAGLLLRALLIGGLLLTLGGTMILASGNEALGTA